MVSEYWHLLIPVVLGALIVWGLRAARQATLLVVAALLLVFSGWLAYTLVLEEMPYAEWDLNSAIETAVWISIPAIIALALAVIGLRRIGGRRPRTA